MTPADPYGDGSGSAQPPQNNYNPDYQTPPPPPRAMQPDTVLSNRPGTNSPSAEYGGNTASNSEKVWVKPHWKNTNDGWVWIEGYWKPRT